MTKYFKGGGYRWLCNNCQNAIDDAYELIVEGLVDEKYIDDVEGPCMLAYDKGWLKCCN